MGGYDENLVVGEDFDLVERVRKANYRTERCRATIKHYQGEISLKKLVTKTYYYGTTLPSYAKKELPLALKTSSPLRYAKNISLIRENPVCYVGLCLLKFIEYGAYLTGATAYFIFRLAGK